MDDLLLSLCSIALLVIAYILYRRHRERVLMERLNRAGRDKAAVLSVVDDAIRDRKAREEFWRKQNPHGL